MPKQPQPKAPHPPVTEKAHAHQRGVPVLARSDVETILLELANRLAPADVHALMAAEHALRVAGAGLRADGLPRLGDQLGLALDCLRDHVEGACPQIPYYTISLLAAAVSYFADELDVIPDFLPHVGRLDDAAVMSMAYELAHDGLQRYCDWKGLHLESLLGPRSLPT